MTLTATNRCRAVSSARYTTPIPPRSELLDGAIGTEPLRDFDVLACGAPASASRRTVDPDHAGDHVRAARGPWEGGGDRRGEAGGDARAERDRLGDRRQLGQTAICRATRSAASAVPRPSRMARIWSGGKQAFPGGRSVGDKISELLLDAADDSRLGGVDGPQVDPQLGGDLRRGLSSTACFQKACQTSGGSRAR